MANINNYQSSDLTDSSVLGMGFGGDGSGGVGNTLYIGTFGQGLWAIDTNTADPDWRLE